MIHRLMFIQILRNFKIIKHDFLSKPATLQVKSKWFNHKSSAEGQLISIGCLSEQIVTVSKKMWLEWKKQKPPCFCEETNSCLMQPPSRFMDEYIYKTSLSHARYAPGISRDMFMLFLSLLLCQLSKNILLLKFVSNSRQVAPSQSIWWFVVM